MERSVGGVSELCLATTMKLFSRPPDFSDRSCWAKQKRMSARQMPMPPREVQVDERVSEKTVRDSQVRSMGEAEDGSEPRQYWLVKTEPSDWSWADQAANDGVSRWDGIRNVQAQGFMKEMRKGDLCFFYHLGGKGREVVGVTKVIKEWYISEDND